MATVLTNDANYTAIADAIRAKGGEGTFTPAQMAAAIANLPSGGADKVLTSAIITGTSSKIDISNYTTDNNFILFFGIKFSPQVYATAMYTPTIPFEIDSSTTEYGGFIAFRNRTDNFIMLQSLGLTQVYTNTTPGDYALAIAKHMSRDYLTYSNGIITAKNSNYPFATSSILIYLAEATT